MTLQVRRVQEGYYRFQLLGDPRARSDRKRIVLPDGDDDRTSRPRAGFSSAVWRI